MKKIIASFAPTLVLLLSACGASPTLPVQKAQKANPGPVHSLNMEQLCRQNAAHRYNTRAEQIDVTGFEHFQGSYEMRGETLRKETFICAFDAEGQFLHLSMR